MEQVKTEEMERLIQKLDGVIAVKIVSGDDGVPEEVHILADREKNPKQLSRDVQSAVSAAFGTTISHSIISIACIDEDVVRKNEETPARLKISGLNISYSGNVFKAEVALNMEGSCFRGECRRSSGAGSRAGGVAEATLSAVNQFVGYEAFSLYEVQKVRVGAYHVMVAAVTYCDSRRGERMLTGTATIQDDEYFSMIKSVLSAVNRVLPVIGSR